MNKTLQATVGAAKAIASERGHKAASIGVPVEHCPYISKEMRSAWIAGHKEFTDKKEAK